MTNTDIRESIASQRNLRSSTFAKMKRPVGQEENKDSDNVKTEVADLEKIRKRDEYRAHLINVATDSQKKFLALISANFNPF